jgi:hypothetical protein
MPILLDRSAASGAILPPPVGLAASLRGFAKCIIEFAALVAAAGFAFGIMDARACGDTAAAAEAKAFWGLNDIIVDGCRTVSLKLFSSLDLLNIIDATAQATAFCLAELLAKGAAYGAMAYGVLTRLGHA